MFLITNVISLISKFNYRVRTSNFRLFVLEIIATENVNFDVYVEKDKKKLDGTRVSLDYEMRCEAPIRNYDMNVFRYFPIFMIIETSRKFRVTLEMLLTLIEYMSSSSTIDKIGFLSNRFYQIEKLT